jgi:outer membrane receptor for ferrienterochelin and colicin
MDPVQQPVSTFGRSARMARLWALRACLVGAGLGASPGHAAEVADLLAMDLNRLLDVEVSLASRREQNAFELPAALVVLTAEDIRRSGHLQLADVLRDVPGFHVGTQALLSRPAPLDA